MEKKRESDVSVEAINRPVFIVETVSVDRIIVLPCAVDVVFVIPISVDTVADDTVALDPWIVEKTARFHEMVEPAIVEPPIVLTAIDPPEKVE